MGEANVSTSFLGVITGGGGGVTAVRAATESAFGFVFVVVFVFVGESAAPTEEEAAEARLTISSAGVFLSRLMPNIFRMDDSFFGFFFVPPFVWIGFLTPLSGVEGVAGAGPVPEIPLRTGGEGGDAAAAASLRALCALGTAFVLVEIDGGRMPAGRAIVGAKSLVPCLILPTFLFLRDRSVFFSVGAFRRL